MIEAFIGKMVLVLFLFLWGSLAAKNYHEEAPVFRSLLASGAWGFLQACCIYMATVVIGFILWALTL